MDNVEYVSCVIQGGLGNQLFQIAAAYDYGFKYNKTPIFKNVDNLYNPFNHERKTFWKTLFSNKLNVVDDDEYNKIQFTHINEARNNIYNELPYAKGNVMLHGYFQSYKYISEKTRIKMIELIYSNEDYMYEAYDIYEKIKKIFGDVEDDDMISLHIRRGDYLLIDKFHTNLDKEYYDKSYDKSCSIGNKKRAVVVFSDDIEWCKSNIKYDKIYFIDINNVSVEFILLSLFQNNIIANSTFSWFASYISSFKDKIVIAPKKWFDVNGPQQFSDIFTDKMIII